MLNKLDLLSGFAVAALAAAGSAIAADDPRLPKPCESSHILTPYKPPGFDFATTSWERAEKNAFVYRTCVENHDDQKTLFVDWLIPGPHGYIAAKDSSVSPRPFATHKTADVTSCLKYGNLRHTLMAQHIGHESDLPRAKEQGDCSKLSTQALQVEGAEVPWFSADGRLSIPSDADNIDATLIRFVYEIGLLQDGAGRYRTLLAYRAAPASNGPFLGNIQAITIRPSAAIVQQALMRLGQKDGLIVLGKFEDRFEIPMELPPKFGLQEFRYRFYDARNRLVGEIAAPFLAR